MSVDARIAAEKQSWCKGTTKNVIVKICDLASPYGENFLETKVPLSQIAFLLGRSTRTISRHIRKLIEDHRIERIRRGRSKTGRALTSITVVVKSWLNITVRPGFQKRPAVVVTPGQAPVDPRAEKREKAAFERLIVSLFKTWGATQGMQEEARDKIKISKFRLAMELTSTKLHDAVKWLKDIFPGDPVIEQLLVPPGG